MKFTFLKFADWADSLKKNKKNILALIILNTIMAIASNIVDWPWLMSVQWYLMPFTPICSLYPLTLAIWFVLKYCNKKIPAWYTTFIFIGITSYGVMAYIYYPFYINWDGIQVRLIGNMIWVTIYALQSFIIASDLKRLPFYQYLLIFGYFGFKDYADRYLGTFIDILNDGFPQSLIDLFWTSIIILHIAASALAIILPIRSKKKELAIIVPKTNSQ